MYLGHGRLSLSVTVKDGTWDSHASSVTGNDRRPDQYFLIWLHIFLYLSWLLFLDWFFIFIIIEMKDVQSSDTSSISVSHPEKWRNFKKPSHYLSKLPQLLCLDAWELIWTYFRFLLIIIFINFLHFIPFFHFCRERSSMSSKYWLYFPYLLTLDPPHQLILPPDYITGKYMHCSSGHSFLHNMVKKQISTQASSAM